MAKRGAIIDIGRHKPLGSSWRSMDTLAYSRSYEPETRPEFRCFVTGQADAANRAYKAQIESEAKQQRLLALKARMLAKGLL